MRIAVPVLLFLAASLSSLTSQQQTAPNPHFEVGEDRLISSGPDFSLVEPYLTVNPKDPNNMLAAAMAITKPDMSRMDCAAFTTFDGGRTWTRHDFGLRMAADVWVAFLPDGTAILSTLETTERDESPLLLYRSTDGGRSWPSKPVSLGDYHDHPTLLVDRFSKQFAGSLYAISGRGWKNAAGKSRSAIYVGRSSDGGLTFPDPAHVIVSNLSYEAHNPAILSDGTLLVPFDDHRRPGDRRRLDRARAWLITSTDGGKSFSEPMLISESCTGSAGWSSMAVGEGRFRDRIYHLCGAIQGINPFGGIVVRYSDDRGDRWSDEIRINRLGNYEPLVRTPALAVNKDGVLGVVWYDARNDGSTIKGNFRCQEIFFTASVDGGETFLPDVKISSQRTCPASSANIPTALRFPAGGEYIGMVATPDGAFQVLWSDNRSGAYQLRMATVRVKPKVSSANN